MKPSQLWKAIAVGVLAGVTLSVSAAAVVSLRGGPAVIDFAERHDRKAYQLLTAASDRRTLDAAAREAERALALSPYSNSARLRLIYIDTVQRGAAGPAGLGHLKQSYDLAPLDYSVAAWRVRFALEHWRELPPELRRAAEAEAMAFGRVGSRDADVRSSLASIHSPEGRLTAALWLLALNQPASPASPPHHAR